MTLVNKGALTSLRGSLRPFLSFEKVVITIIKKQLEPISAQDWIPIKDITGDKVILKDGTFVKIIEVEPINFELESEFEQEAILESYKRFLKSCNFDMQIFIQSQVTDISNYLSKIKKLRSEDDLLKDMSDDYINFVQEISSSKRNVSKKFYIVIKGSNNLEENINKIREGMLSSRKCD